MLEEEKKDVVSTSSDDINQEEENVIAGLNQDSVSEVLYSVDTSVDLSNIASDIESQRKEFFSKNNRVSLITKITNPIMIVIIIIGAIFMFLDSDNDVYNILSYSLMGGGVGVLIIVYIVIRFIRPNASKYISFVTKSFNSYMYQDKRYSKVIADEGERLQLVQVTSDRVYQSISDVGSRNVCKGFFNKYNFLACELSLNGKDKQGNYDLFLGKYITYENLLKFDGRVIINIKLSSDGSVKNFDLPNDVSDLVKVKEEDTLTIYASEGLHYEDIVDKKLLDTLSKFEVNRDKHLLGVNLVIWGGHSALYLSYDNDILAMPYKNEFTIDNINQLRDQQLLGLELLSLLCKSKRIATDVVIKPEVEEVVSTQTNTDESSENTQIEENQQ